MTHLFQVPGWLSGGVGDRIRMLLCGVGGAGLIPALLPVCLSCVFLPPFLSVSTINKAVTKKIIFCFCELVKALLCEESSLFFI